MRIAIATDAWYPQPNGVVRVLASVIAGLRMRVISAGDLARLFTRSIPCPTYPELPITLWPGARVRDMLAHFDADVIHIATEGTIGSAAQRYCWIASCRSRPPITPSSRNILPRAPICRCAGSTPPCANSTAPRPASWCRDGGL